MYSIVSTRGLLTCHARHAVAGQGAVPLLLGMLETGKAQMSAARGLAKLALHNREIQDAIAENGGIAPLLALLNGVNIPAQVEAAGSHSARPPNVESSAHSAH